MSTDVSGQADKFAILEARCAQAEAQANLAIARCATAEARSVATVQMYVQSSRRMRVTGCLAALICIGAMLISPGNKAIAQGYGESLRTLIADVSTLKTQMGIIQDKTKYMSVSGSTTLFSSCNVQITNGTGATDGDQGFPASPLFAEDEYNTNGLGNLIIGYNQNNGQPETGSHNLILGDRNGYTSFGGIVSGYGNLITGPYDSVTGGSYNHADQYYSTVTGGDHNLASGSYSSVSGGNANESRGLYSSVTGGSSNIAPGMDSTCLGGDLCRSDDNFSAVLGGYNTTLNTGSDDSHFP